MSRDDITLVCEGEPRGRDVRWLNLVVSELAGSFEPAARVKVVPAGSKADLKSTVRGMREALRTRRVYAIRDRDFLRAELLKKDVDAGVCSFERHCLESYLVEPAVLEDVFGLQAMEAKLVQLAERRFWLDVGCAVLDAVNYEVRKDRLSFGDEAPDSKTQVTEIVRAKVGAFRGEIGGKLSDVEALVESFEHDMRSSPLWMRVNGKDLMKSLAKELDASVLPSGDIEARLFKWCSENGPPMPFVSEMRRILTGLPDSL